MNPVSIIIPTYNRLDFLKISVQSVLEQTYKQFELIIVDDGSTDDTKQWITSLSDKRIKYIHQINQGASSARNTGIKQAQYDFIAFLDSDDRWVKNKLEKQMKLMLDNPKCMLSHTEELWYRNGKILNPKFKHKKKSGNIFNTSLKLCSISMSTVIVKKTLFDKMGLFDTNLTVCEDYDMWLRVTEKHYILLIDEPLTIKEGGHSDQLSQRFIGMDKFRIQSITKLIETRNLSMEHFSLAFAELEKKCYIYGNGCLKHNKEKEGSFYLNLPNRIKNKYERKS